MSTSFSTVRIDGDLVAASTASIPVTDVGFIRGYGVFEVARGLGGRIVRLEAHLDRLRRSAAMMGIELPSDDEIASWCQHAAAEHADCMIRVLVSAGDDAYTGTTRIVVTSEAAPDQPDSLTLHPLDAPWHADGADWELLRAKTLSYANNFGSRRKAKLAGFDDALLIGRSGRLLEGPTFSVGWTVVEGDRTVYETPALSLGILDSITRQIALDAADSAGLEFREVEVALDHLDMATEFFAISTLKDAVSVTSVGDRAFPVGPAVAGLRDAMADLTQRELGAV